MTKSLGICEGRHSMPSYLDGYIYKQFVDPLDINNLEKTALVRLVEEFPEREDTPTYKGGHLNLYVTGLSQALVSILNMARALDIKVTLYHYDKMSGKFYPQEVR